MPRAAPRQAGKKLARALTDELGLTTPKTVGRGRALPRGPARVAKKPSGRVKKF